MEVKQDEITQEQWEEIALGTIVKGRELGKESQYTKFMWIVCPECGRGRWSQVRKDMPKLCHTCSNRRNMSNYVSMRGHPYNWKGGRKEAGDYIRILKPDHPRADRRGYVLEHILVWEQVNNKLLPEGWIVHHLNGVKKDNRPENLIAFPSRKHQHVLAAKAQRIRELEAKLKILERALDQNQLIYWGEN